MSGNGTENGVRRERLERLGLAKAEREDATPPAAPARRRLFPFPGLIFVLIGANMCVVAITVFLATSDESVAVEPNYYSKGLRWDEKARDMEWSRRLGWSATVEANAGSPRTLGLSLKDKQGGAVEGARVSVVAFHNARAGDRLEFELAESSPGVYTATAPMDRAGSWRFRVSARRGADHYLSEFDKTLAPVAVAMSEKSR